MKNTLKIVLVLFTLTTLNSCKDNKANNTENKSETSIEKTATTKRNLLEQLKNKKRAIDALYEEEKLAEKKYSMDDEGNYKLISEDKNPLKSNSVWFWSTNGIVKLVEEYPYSKNGNYNLNMLHYFDDDGKVIIFQKNSTFYSDCSKNIATETITEFYDTDFNKIDSLYSFKDEKGKDLNKEKCLIHNFEYTVFKSIEKFKEANKIK